MANIVEQKTDPKLIYISFIWTDNIKYFLHIFRAVLIFISDIHFPTLQNEW